MKIFEDLYFKPHPYGIGLQAKMFFENGYGVSVVRFKTHGLYFSYTDNENEWELAVLFGDENDSYISYSTDITDNVLGHLSSDEVTDIMIKIQNL